MARNIRFDEQMVFNEILKKPVLRIRGVYQVSTEANIDVSGPHTPLPEIRDRIVHDLYAHVREDVISDANVQTVKLTERQLLFIMEALKRESFDITMCRGPVKPQDYDVVNDTIDTINNKLRQIDMDKMRIDHG